MFQLLDKNRNDYIKILNSVGELEPWFSKINFRFSHDLPGEPGWTGTAVNAIDAARAKKDHGLFTKIISIDPQPRAEIDAVCDTVIRESLETYDLSLFSSLKAGDIVFTDGSHRSFMNSDVTIFRLDILPELKPGVIVQIHDIALPLDYHPYFTECYWNEQYILAAYLIGASDKIKILMPNAHMPETSEIKQGVSPILKNWQGNKGEWLNGGSIWFTHIK